MYFKRWSDMTTEERENVLRIKKEKYDSWKQDVTARIMMTTPKIGVDSHLSLVSSLSRIFALKSFYEGGSDATWMAAKYIEVIAR